MSIDLKKNFVPSLKDSITQKVVRFPEPQYNLKNNQPNCNPGQITSLQKNNGLIINFEKEINRNGTNSVKIEDPRDTYNMSNLISLGCADFEFGVPQQIQEALQARLNHPIHGYTRYSNELIQSIQGYYQRHHSMEIKREDMFFTPGVVPAVAIALRSLINPGDGVCLVNPEYPPFSKLIQAGGYTANICHMKKIENGFQFDFKEFENQIKKSKVFLFSSPHNPTGTVLNKTEMLQIIDICNKHNVYILFDEIWSDLVYAPAQHIPIQNLAQKNIITFYAPSKSFNIAGLQMSFALTKDPELQKKFKLEQQKLHMTSSNIFGLAGMEAAYSKCDDYLKQFKMYVQNNLQLCYEYFNKNMPDIWTFIPDSTTLLWIDFGKYFKTSEDAEKWCAQQGVYLQKGSDFCKCNESVFLRMNCGSPKKLLLQAMEQIFKGYKQLKPIK